MSEQWSSYSDQQQRVATWRTFLNEGSFLQRLRKKSAPGLEDMSDAELRGVFATDPDPANQRQAAYLYIRRASNTEEQQSRTEELMDIAKSKDPTPTSRTGTTALGEPVPPIPDEPSRLSTRMPTTTPAPVEDEEMVVWAKKSAPPLKKALESGGSKDVAEARTWIARRTEEEKNALINALADIGHTFVEDDSADESPGSEETDIPEPLLNSDDHTLTVIHFLGLDDAPLDSIHYPTDEAWMNASERQKRIWYRYYADVIQDRGQDSDGEDPLYRSFHSFFLKPETDLFLPEAFRQWLAWEIENPEKTPEVKAWCGEKECTPADIESKRESLKELYILEESQMRRWHQLAGINPRVL